MTTYKTKTENGMTHYWCEEDKMYYPEYRTNEETGITCKLNPEQFVYYAELEYTSGPEEQELVEEPTDRCFFMPFIKE
ncbi:MAG: hypothetical protein LBU36_00740 [Clostridiales bacterium]|jgi:hypothetical protein|nr:hypothetical protein [Clostridiales bacterium]